VIIVAPPSPTAPTGAAATALEHLWADKVIIVIRADEIPDPVGMCRALSAGGIRTIEFTFTTPNVEAHVRRATRAVGDTVAIGVGTVLSADQARRAIDAGARFLVTPCVRHDVAAVAGGFDVPILMGAMTPGEVLTAHESGAAAVKIFPAGALGPKYLKDLHGPFPNIALVPSGGISKANAADYLACGAAAVTAGTSVVEPGLIAASSWTEVSERASAFVTSLQGTP
jgi:2-dehydro-3-deoxyphosphogluconate aldolase / (4S)-4-hydroxy-2-oxoglutarate aldolase